MAIAEQEKTLWKIFNLGNLNPSKGGGVMYFLRYSPERINTHRNQVVSALKAMDVELRDCQDKILVRTPVPYKDLTKTNKSRLSALLEELSVLNEATEFNETYGDCRTLDQLGDRLIQVYWALLDSQKLANAYNFVSMGIPEIVQGLKQSEQNHALYKREKTSIEKLAEFARRKTKYLGRTHGFVILGRRFR